MATEKQVAANRENAKRSTGPRTPEGKARVSRNALAHGYTAQDFVMGQYEQQELLEMASGLWSAWEPVDDAEAHVLYEYLRASWNLKRIGRDEAQCIEQGLEQAAEEDEPQVWPGIGFDGQVKNLARYRQENMRAQKHAFGMLLALRKERRESEREGSKREVAESKARQEGLKERVLEEKLLMTREMRAKRAGAKQSQFSGQGSVVRGQETGNTRGRKGPGKAPKAA